MYGYELSFIYLCSFERSCMCTWSFRTMHVLSIFFFASSYNFCE